MILYRASETLLSWTTCLANMPCQHLTRITPEHKVAPRFESDHHRRRKIWSYERFCVMVLLEGRYEMHLAEQQEPDRVF